MGESKINIGKFVDCLQFMQPIRNKSTTGEITTELIPGNKILCELSDDTENSERVDDALSGKLSLKFTSWKYEGVSTEWKVNYKGVIYDIDKITNVQRGLYAIYECSKEKVE